jgi:hypothetical protein
VKFVVGLFVLIVVSVAADQPQTATLPKMRPLTDRKFERTPERLRRGKYLSEGTASCLVRQKEN